MNKHHYKASYEKHIALLLEKHGTEKAMSVAVGGDYEAVGKLEYALLLQYGLERTHTVIDVGCGSGRLGFQLRKFLDGRYIGIDVIPAFTEYAKMKCARPDWFFYEAPGLTIPEDDGCADYICFFSVFTHLLHEETYKYLVEASRVVKPEGKIIFTFLDFKIPYHWHAFEQALVNEDPDKVLNQFMSRDAIECWVKHLKLRITDIQDGDKPHIELQEVIKWEDGSEMIGKGYLGQSVCILAKT